MNIRDKELLESIIANIDQLASTIARHQIDYAKFQSDVLYKDAVAMSVFQVTELVAKVSKELRNQYQHLPWAMIVGMRNRFAHAYDVMSDETIWLTATEDLLTLKGFCLEILGRQW